MVKEYLSLIKFSHTIFALPFALLGFHLGIFEQNHNFSFKIFVLVIACMVFARSAAMAFNRYIDRDIDEINPRSKMREIPAGIISARGALIFVIINSLGFILATYLINKTCFMLSLIALGVVLGYSLTKRFTFLCHLILGLGLALAPIGAYIAVTSHFGTHSILMGISVLFWVAGFDIIYALQDEDFDQKNKLYSIPSKFGAKNSLLLSKVFHFSSGTLLTYCVYSMTEHYGTLGLISYVGLTIFLLMLTYQQTLVKANDLSKVNLAFFTTNGIASVVFGGLVIIDFHF
jgi:4-hydroxybenzoate polyprenyltransferase